MCSVWCSFVRGDVSQARIKDCQSSFSFVQVPRLKPDRMIFSLERHSDELKFSPRVCFSEIDVNLSMDHRLGALLNTGADTPQKDCRKNLVFLFQYFRHSKRNASSA